MQDLQDRCTDLLRKRAARKGRAWAQGTIPLSTPLATILTGLSCIWAKAVATCRYTGSSAPSLARMAPSMPAAPRACKHAHICLNTSTAVLQSGHTGWRVHLLSTASHGYVTTF